MILLGIAMEFLYLGLVVLTGYIIYAIIRNAVGKDD